MSRRFLLLLALALLALALLAPDVLAEGRSDAGEGLYGETDDKVVTNAGFILIAAFPLFILLMTLIQSRLDRRKDARKAAAKARAKRGDLPAGW